MNKNYLKAFRAKNQKTGPSQLMKFFTEDNVNGIMSKAEFQHYIHASNDSELDHLDTLFLCIVNGANINNTLKQAFDKIDGHEIIWFNVRMPKAEFPALRIQYDEKIMRFFQEYQMGKVRFSTKLRDLMAEAGLEVQED